MIRPSLMNSFPAILATLDIWLQTISFLSFVNIGDSSVCTPKDFTFEYTNCDSNGQRWRVAIPNRTPLQCEGGVPIPTIAVNCSFSCGPGMYLDIDSQQCRPCEKGTYSLGGGIRFDEFPQLPPGFSVENIDISTDSILSDAGHTLNETSCPKETGWIVKNTELIYVLSPCISKMTYSVTLVRPGYVEYSYRMPKNSRGLVFNVVVKNEQCQSYRDQLKLQLESALKSAKSRSEESGTWQTKRIELRTGPNIITWSVTNNRESSSHGEFIVISKIDVVGIAYTHQCSLCPAGTFSERGARQCSPCAAGYFSTKGSSECSKCAFSQYSGPKAAKCLEKPACTNDDYYAVSEPCIHGVTRTVYRKVKPTICRDDLPGAVRLPRAGPQHKCPPCNPGMSLGSSGKCEFCPKRHFSDGSECKRCPMNSIPNYGFQYVLWHNLPANMESRCEYIMEDSSSPCDIGESWLPSGDAVHTSPSYERGIALELVLSVHEGFSNPLSSSETRPSVQNPIAHITFVFETECFDASCVLYFVEDSPNQSFYRLIADFSGTQQRRAYSHPIISPLPTTFIFAFMRSGSSSLDDHITDRASIFSINVTNVAKEGGGASACLQCSSFDGECVPCSHGEYITEDGNRCQICPETTMLNTSSDRIGIKSCIQCGPNLHSSDGTECSSDGKLSINVGNNQTRKFDLSPLLSRTFIANGVRVFAREGSSYFHVFNISLFNANAICKESVGSVDFGLHGSIAIEPQEKVETSICRLTALPVHQIQNSSHHIVYVSPLSLGGQLIAITSERNFKTVSLSDKDLEYEGLTNDTQPLDIHLYYSSSSAPTDICTQGFHSVVTLRCDQNAINVSEARLPHGCPDGTCDGCLYHIIIATSYACPLCTDDDFTVIKGECLNGIQTIHSIPARHCVMSGITNKETLAPCTSMSLSVEILITTMVLMAIALCITVVLVCQRNKRLEYKYMKLVESQVGADGIEIIGTESCGLDHDEDEEEEEKVIFAKGKNRSFGGLNKSRRQPISEFRGSFANSERSAFVALEETD